MVDKLTRLLNKLGKINDRLASTTRRGDFKVKENSRLWRKLVNERMKVRNQLDKY